MYEWRVPNEHNNAYNLTVYVSTILPQRSNNACPTLYELLARAGCLCVGDPIYMYGYTYEATTHHCHRHHQSLGNPRAPLLTLATQQRCPTCMQGRVE